MAIVAVVIPDPVKQFLDGNGKPYAAGLLYSYAAGTTTPQVTYSDAALTVPNTNPVVLDANGRATIYLDALNYKFILKDVNLVQIWSQDNIAGSVWPGGINANVTLNPAINANSLGHQFNATLNKAASGTHALFTGAYIAAPVIGPGASTLTEATTLYVAGAPAAGSSAYAVHVAAGISRFDGSLAVGRNVLTYSATMAVDASLASLFEVVPTDGVAFAFSVPTNANAGQVLTIRIKNTFGALGVATFTAGAGGFRIGAAWTQPANGFSRSIRFEYDGAVWVETARSAADVTN